MNFMRMLAAEATLIPGEVRAWLLPTIEILMALIGIVLIVVVLMQKGTSDNIGAIGGQEVDTYAGKNKTRSKESVLKIVTMSLGGALLVFSIIFFIAYL